MFVLQLKPLLRIVVLRYTLLWASLRTNRGRAVLLSGAILLVTTVGMLFALGGIGGGIAAVQLGKTQMVARAVLTALLAGSIGFSLTFGLGAKTVFEDRSLRHFPLNSASRFAARHLVGILDPIWLIVLMCALGFTLGLQIMGACSLVIGAPAMLLFVVACYLCSAVLQTLLHKLLQRKAAALILLVALFLMCFIVLVAIDGARHAHSRPHFGNVLLDLTPAAPAAAALTGNNPLFQLAAAGLLLLWIVGVFAALSLAERLDLRRNVRATYDPGQISFYDRIAGLFPAEMAPFVGKSLRYHLRCNRVRYMMVIGGPLIGMQFIINARRMPLSARFSALFALIYVVAPATTLIMALNHFGWDEGAVRRYPLLPVRMATVLRAYSLVSMLLGAIVTIPFTFILIAIAKVPLDWRAVTVITFDLIATLMLSHAVAPWVAVKAPRRVEFNSMMGNVLSGPAYIVNVLILAPGLIVILIAMGKHAMNLLEWWWAMPLLATLAAAAYWYSIMAAGRAMESSREKLVQTLSPTGD